MGGVYCSTWRVFSECILFAEFHCQFFLGNDYCNEIVIPAHRFVACQREHVQCMVVQWCFLFWQCGLQRWQCHQGRLVSQDLGKENKPVNTSFSGICLKAAGRKLFFFFSYKAAHGLAGCCFAIHFSMLCLTVVLHSAWHTCLTLVAVVCAGIVSQWAKMNTDTHKMPCSSKCIAYVKLTELWTLVDVYFFWNF